MPLCNVMQLQLQTRSKSDQNGQAQQQDEHAWAAPRSKAKVFRLSEGRRARKEFQQAAARRVNGERRLEKDFLKI